MIPVWGLIALLWFAGCNLYGFVLMGIDKRRAQKGRWRVKEKTFFLIALFGGAPGVWLGMRRWRHKTKHMSFRLGIPFLTMLWGLAVLFMAFP